MKRRVRVRFRWDWSRTESDGKVPCDLAEETDHDPRHDEHWTLCGIWIRRVDDCYFRQRSCRLRGHRRLFHMNWKGVLIYCLCLEMWRSVEVTESGSLFLGRLSTFSGTTSFFGETFGSSGCFTLSHGSLLLSTCFPVRHGSLRGPTFTGRGTIISGCLFEFSLIFLWLGSFTLWLYKVSRTRYNRDTHIEHHILLRIFTECLNDSTFDDWVGPENAEFSFLIVLRPPLAFIDLKDKYLWVVFTDQIIPEFDTYGEYSLNKVCNSLCNGLFVLAMNWILWGESIWLLFLAHFLLFSREQHRVSWFYSYLRVIIMAKC